MGRGSGEPSSKIFRVKVLAGGGKKGYWSFAAGIRGKGTTSGDQEFLGGAIQIVKGKELSTSDWGGKRGGIECSTEQTKKGEKGTKLGDSLMSIIHPRNLHLKWKMRGVTKGDSARHVWGKGRKTIDPGKNPYLQRQKGERTR